MHPRNARSFRRVAFYTVLAIAVACGGEKKEWQSDPDNSSGDDDADDDDAPRDAGKGRADAGRPKPSSGDDDDDSPITGNDKDDMQDEDVCDSVDIQAKPNAPQILVVLDRSGSMVGFGQPPNAMGAMINRWDPSANAVKKLTSDLAGVANFGLMLFPGSGGGMMGGGMMGGGITIPGLGTLPIPGPGGGGTCTPGTVNVPVGANSAAQIAMTLDRSRPDIGATPTAATLENAYGVLVKENCADCADSPKFVLLVTDGQPNCGMNGTMTTQADIDASNAALDKLLMSGVKTYVIGYDMASDMTSAGIMQQFAMHGGTDEFIPVENENELSTQLRRIAGSLISCEYELNQDVPDPKLVRVVIDDKEYVLGEGWNLDGRKIVLAEEENGACRVIRDGRVHNVQIRRECEPRVFQ